MRRTLAAAVAVLAAGAFGCTPKGSSDDLAPISVGVIVPLSGELSGLGRDWENAALMAGAEVNATGGLFDGRLLELIVRDSETNPIAGAAAATELIEDLEVVGIIGAAASAITLEVATITTAAEVPQISCCSTSTLITDLDDGGHLFRTVPSDALQGRVLAIHATELALFSCAVLHTDDAYGLSLRDAFITEFQALGGIVEGMAGFAISETDMVDEVAAALGPATTCGVLIAYPDTGAAVILQQIASGLATGIQWLGTDGLKSSTFVNDAGSANVVGMIGTAPVSLGQAYDDFLTGYEIRYGEPPVIFSANQYDATLLLALAISYSRGTDPAAIRDALVTVSAGGETFSPGSYALMADALRAGTNINFDGASGPVDFDSNGDVLGNFEVWRIAGDGTFVQDRIIYAGDLM